MVVCTRLPPRGEKLLSNTCYGIVCDCDGIVCDRYGIAVGLHVITAHGSCLEVMKMGLHVIAMRSLWGYHVIAAHGSRLEVIVVGLHVIAMRLRGIAMGVHVGLIRDRTRLLWDCGGVAVGSYRDCYGRAVGLLWDSHVIAT